MTQSLTFACRRQAWTFDGTPWIMGILNVTPDSFSDGGKFINAEDAANHALAMVAAGARIIDIGGESTRPGAEPADEATEIARTCPVIQTLRRRSDVLISIDTQKAAVAAAAVAAGADMVNDVSGLRRDPEMPTVVAETRAGCVAMHMRGTPATMQQFTDYDDLVAEISKYFLDTLKLAAAAGIGEEHLIFDPGIGFSKTAEQSLELIAATGRFRDLGRPILLGPSRKSFIGKILDQAVAAERGWGTAAAITACVLNGADILRVHDVPEMLDVTRVAAAIRDA